MAAQIMIELVPDTTKLKSTLDNLTDSGAVGGSDAAAFKEGNAELEKKNKLLNQNAAAVDKVEKAERKELATMKDVGKGAVQMSGALASGVAEVTSEVNKQTAANKKNSQSHEEVEGAVEGEVNANISLRNEKKKLTAEIANLILKGEQESQMFRDLVARAGEIDDAMADASDAIRRTGSDTRGLDNALLAAEGVASAFSVATGVTAVFGIQSEKVEKILSVTNGAMAILNGLQGVQNVLKNEYVRSLIASVTAQRADIAAKETEIVVTEGATVAQLELNAAVLANPYVLAAAAIIALVAAVGLFITYSEEAEESQKRFNDAIDPKHLQAYHAQLQATNDITVALLNLRGAKGSEIAEQELRTLEAQHDATVRQREQVRLLAATQKEGSDERKKAEEEFQALFTQAENENLQLVIKNIDIEKQKRDELNDEIVRNAKARTDIDLANARAGSKAERDARIQAVKDELDAVKRDSSKTLQEKMAAEAVANRQIADLRKDFSENQQTQAIEDEKARAEIRLAYAKTGSKQELDAKIALLEAGKKAELNNATLTAVERKAIEVKTGREIAELRADFRAKEKQKALESDQALLESEMIQFEKMESVRLDLQIQSINKQRDIELLNTQLTQEQRILINTKADKAIADARIASVTKTINEAAALEQSSGDVRIAALKRVANDVTASEKKRFQASQDARNEEIANIEKEQARITKLHEAGALSEQDFKIQTDKLDIQLADKKAERDNASADRSKAIRKAVADAAIQVASEVANTIFEIENQKREEAFNAQVDAITKERDLALQTKNLTEQQKADIQKQYDAKLAALKNENAKKERRAQTLQAIVNTALAVTSALTAPPPLGFIAAGLAAALGLVQIARINSTPIPQYRKGVKNAPPGMALVGEEGPELIAMNGGENVYTAKETDAILKSWKSAEDQRSYFYKTRESAGMRIDYEEIGKAVARHMPELATVNMIADEEGLSIFLETQANRRTIRNRRYSTGL